MKLGILAKKNRNRLTCAEEDDAAGNLLELMLNIIVIRGDDYASLPKHLEDSENRSRFLNESCFDMSSSRLRDSCMLEIEN